ncbi:hypothetical protein [Sphingomonas sp. SFZ2018-12]|uniref:hypothetical protein n=1 Tax=Sphingomonas sp. SFZ2018-12 TaxID=2683197 RepID=UPI000A499E9B|nr:hypothetical protein [Sphingomonas sp. SFZ2018-12]
MTVAIIGPIVVLIFGARLVKWLLIALFVAGTVGIPLAAASEPVEFRGSALIISVLIFTFGLVAINIAGALKAPRRVQ